MVLELPVSATTMIKLTLCLLSFGFATTLFLLNNEISKVKEAIAIICAADPKLTAKITKLLKPRIPDFEEEVKE